MSTLNLVVGVGGVNTVKAGAYGAVEADAVDLGKTEGGVEIAKSEEVKEIFCDQANGVIAAPTIKEGVTFKFSMQEATLANIALAWGQPLASVVGNEFGVGGKSDIYDYRTMYINVKGPGPGTRKYTIHKAKIKGDSSQKYVKDSVTLVPVEVTAIQDLTKPAGSQFMTVSDSGLDATPPTVALTAPVDGGTTPKDAKGAIVWGITEVNGVDWNTVKYGDTFVILNTTVPATAAPVAGVLTYDAAAKTVTFTPTANWTASDTLQAMVTTGFKDAAGNSLAAMKVEQFSVTA